MSNYRVLWVEDELEKWESVVRYKAKKFGIDLVAFTNWEEAWKELRANFRDFTAIILDAHCIEKKGGEPTDTFLTLALSDIKSLCDKHNFVLPYYVFSAGSKKTVFFPKIIEMWVKQRDDSWGEFVYSKEDDITGLLEQVAEISKKSLFHQVRNRYQTTFDILDEGQMIENSADVKDLLMTILLELHFPGTNSEFKFQEKFNPLRTAVENLFRTANRYGLLPDELFTCNPDKNEVHANACSRYLAGEVADTPDKKMAFRYGIMDERVFPKVVADSIWSILQVTSPFSHSVDEDTDEERDVRKFIEGNNIQDFLFSYTLQFCNIVAWWGKYLPEHLDVELNKSKKTEMMILPKRDNQGIWHCGPYEVSLKNWNPSKPLRLEKIVINDKWKSNSQYPYKYYAKYK